MKINVTQIAIERVHNKNIFNVSSYQNEKYVYCEQNLQTDFFGRCDQSNTVKSKDVLYHVLYMVKL